MEGSALYRLLADNTTDIILKTDRQGFIVHASPAIEQLGVTLPSMLIGPHILDLVHPSRAEEVRSEHEAAINGRQDGKWVEFPALTAVKQERWFEIQVRSLADDDNRIYGALSVMRCIEERKRFEDKLFVAEMTDPLTGLTNRKAFISMLQHLVEERSGGCLVLLDIDHFKTINMQFGHSVGDQVLLVFSDLLRNMVRPDDIISRVGSESLAVLLPRTAPDQAERIGRRIINSLSQVRQSVGSKSVAITASGGVSSIGRSVDDTIKQAELALFLAKTKGRNRLEMDNAVRAPFAQTPKFR
jgi:diguanylate cyclase (GGDEF)-like protein/PAS domain S-box-containing protein